ncbi:low molecular weight phosphotyrosine protein phosphatase (plasmid) [Streptomyces sp. Q6]|uniref:Low molecular weight phosphotyrosine protein phosphatase n=1 Tax=Streptomyces citrinus TaxID=3118173 RepID=A0ACD5ARE9_9ACTN
MTGRPRRILTVCLGNYCRSPLAARILADRAGDAAEVRSAGLVDKWVGHTAHPDMIAAAAVRGYDLLDHAPAPVDRAALDWADLVLAMDHSVLEKLLLIADDNAHKIRLYLDGQDVPDPIGQPMAAFTRCAQIIETGAARHLR